MAEAVTPEPDAGGESAEATGAEVSRPLVGPRPVLPGVEAADHRPKFKVVYAALLAVVAGAAAAVVLLLAQSGSDQVSGWLDWAPRSEAADDRAREIANLVAAEYRLADDSQLVTIQSSRLQVQDIPVAAVAVQSAPGGVVFSGDAIPIYEPNETIVYLMCGLGPECAIEEGEPSVERQRLLRREALELSLITFQYVDDVNSIVVFMPPRLGYRPTYALFFQRPDLEDLLDRPLRDVLTPETPLPDTISPTEVATIDQLTNPFLFAFSFTQLQDGRALLVLEDPQNPNAPQPQPVEPATTTGADEGGGTTTTETPE
jgi:hypothetical protein